MKYYVRFEACKPLGNGGATVAVFKTYKEAKEFVGKQDLNIFKNLYGVSPSGHRLRLKSEFYTEEG